MSENKEPFFNSEAQVAVTGLTAATGGLAGATAAQLAAATLLTGGALLLPVAIGAIIGGVIGKKIMD